MHKPTILIDLDGVLNNYAGNYDKDTIPEIKTGAKEFLQKLHDKYDLVLFTTRSLLLSAKWLIDNGIVHYFCDITNVKIPEMLQINDRAVCFRGDYDEMLGEISNFKVHYK